MTDDPVVVDPIVPAPTEPETVTMPKAEVDALRRQAAEAQKEKRKFEADQKKAKEEREAEEGKYREIAETKDRELAQERAERARVVREQRITRIASRMEFLDPEDVIGRVSAEDGEDDALTESALKAIAERSPHLKKQEQKDPPVIGQVLAPAPGTPGVPSAGKAPITSIEDVRKLSQAEINERWDEVAEFMSRPG
jgi:ribonuclease D